MKDKHICADCGCTVITKTDAKRVLCSDCRLIIKSEKITVCDNCFEASCWQGIFMCEKSKNAGIVEKTVDELLELTTEHPSYWENR